MRNRYKIYPLFCLVSLLTYITVSNAEQTENQVETLAEVSIIGSSELPSVSFNLPWRLPSIEKRDEQSPPKELPGVLTPIEPRRHKQKIHFSRFLEVDAPHFRAR